jgi:hypothetical protein
MRFFLLGIGVGSIGLNIFMFIAHGRALMVGKKQAKAFRHLKYRLNMLLDQWSMEDYCMHCKHFGVKHKLDCPQMAVRFAITKAEQEMSRS